MSNSMLILLGGLLAEVVLLALVLLGIAHLRNRAQRKRDLGAVRTLIARIKNGKAEREKVIVQFLEQGMGLSGESLQQAKVAILRGELGMVQRIAGVYRRRDAAQLARIDDALFAAIGPYHALTAAILPAASSDVVDGDELERLRKENQRLREELTITMETMSRMLNEYSTVFAGGTPNGEAAVDATAAAAVGAVTEEGAAITVSGEDTAQSTPVPDDGLAAAEPQHGANAGVVADDVAAPADGEALDVGDVIVAPTSSPDDQDDSAASETAAQADVVKTPAEGDQGHTTSDEDDEIAAIIREAQSQEVPARDSEERAEAIVADDGTTAADVVNGQETSPPVGPDAKTDATIESGEDLDDLFDAAADRVADVIDGGEDAAAGAPDETDVPRKSHGGARPA